MFTQVQEDEKKRLTGDFQKTGSYRGYKPRQTWVSCTVFFHHCNQLNGISGHQQRRAGPD